MLKPVTICLTTASGSEPYKCQAQLQMGFFVQSLKRFCQPLSNIIHPGLCLNFRTCSSSGPLPPRCSIPSTFHLFFSFSPFSPFLFLFQSLSSSIRSFNPSSALPALTYCWRGKQTWGWVFEYTLCNADIVCDWTPSEGAAFHRHDKYFLFQASEGIPHDFLFPIENKTRKGSTKLTLWMKEVNNN